MRIFSLYKPKYRPLKLTSAGWRKLRQKKLTMDPLCEACLAWKMIEEATNVDHIDNDATDNSMSNLMSLCQTCHSKKTGQETNGLPVTIYGIDEDGYQLDPKSDKFRQKKNRGLLSGTNRPPSHTHADAK